MNPIDILLAKPFVNRMGLKPLNFETLKREVASKHNITPDQLLSRCKRYSEPRQELMWRMKDDWSLPDTGELLGLDHSTIYYGIRKHQERMESQA